eukprot:TRINITY_DN3129_c0_g1_i1.p1 TRINITY_DN3129_c0_g1~~TRINITY_DN3129_c0_g1_i1.p1  ORF type:complete len:372 (+),score=82.30 TRINITY_DN3129_c0_g1_i1:174-1289(+)
MVAKLTPLQRKRMKEGRNPSSAPEARMAMGDSQPSTRSGASKLHEDVEQEMEEMADEELKQMMPTHQPKPRSPSSGPAMYRKYARDTQDGGRAMAPSHEEESDEEPTHRQPKPSSPTSGPDMYRKYARDTEAGGRAMAPSREEESDGESTQDQEHDAAIESEGRDRQVVCTEQERVVAVDELNQLEADRQAALKRRADAEAQVAAAEEAHLEQMSAAELDDAVSQAGAIQMERSLREVLDCGTPSDLDEAIRRVGANDPSVIKICIRQNDIGFARAHLLATAIAGSRHLLSLDLRYNKIGDHSCRLLAQAIKENMSLGELRLTPNETGRDGTKFLQQAVAQCQYESMSISSATCAAPELSMSPLLLRHPKC